MSHQLKRKTTDRIELLEERVRVLEAENAVLKQQLRNLKDETITIDLGSIPDYLKRGEYYTNLTGVDGTVSANVDNSDIDSDMVITGNVISVPKKCFKANTEIPVRPNVELVHLLETLRYWMVDTLPDSVIAYALNKNTCESFRSVAEEFWVDIPTLKVLSTVASKGLEEGIDEPIICALEQRAPDEIIHYLFVHYDTEAKLRQDVVIKAAQMGSLECLRYILSTNRCKDLDNICMETAKCGQLNCLKYAHEHGCPWNEETCRLAAYEGQLDCLEYAHEHGCPWNEDTCREAAYKGQLDCLKYAHEHGCPWDEETCRLAAYEGQLDCLEYAHEHGCPWDEETCQLAARRGQLDCLKYAHEHGCRWDEETCRLAAYEGQLDCLKYAHEHGCPWDEETCQLAARRGQLDCLKYAHEQGCRWDAKTCREAACLGHLDCLGYAREHGCPYNS